MMFKPLHSEQNEIINNLLTILSQEYNTIKELTDFEKELRFALLRQVELQQLEYEYKDNPYYKVVSDKNDQVVFTQAQSLIDQLRDAEKN